ncbi:MAG: peptide chain release factor N(5)-glutamine methyltransferase [Caldilineaceae bacterium]|nr:peptide chain release factor N(5)-glutamine methyltransferase [Caldilineaceae bacterium]
MAILQVNERPAVSLQFPVASQRRDRTDETQLSIHHHTTRPSDSLQTDSPDPLFTAQPPAFWQKVVWRLMPSTTIGRALISARERLDEAGSPTASLDAQVILAYVLEVDRSWLFAHHEYTLSAEQANAYTELIERRMHHEPVAYLIGRKEFYGLEFQVDRRVLIPRPETELLVDAVLDFVSARADYAYLVADVGTGSGAIALAVAANAPQVAVYAIDLSTDALAVAQANVTRLDERQQVRLLQGDLLAPLPEAVDVIVANLPYISSSVYPKLDADVRDYEPKLALESGPEGLDAITRLLQQAPNYLRPEGAIFLEISYDQGQAALALAKRLLPNAYHVSLRQDYHGHDRLVTIIL